MLNQSIIERIEFFLRWNNIRLCNMPHTVPRHDNYFFLCFTFFPFLFFLFFNQMRFYLLEYSTSPTKVFHQISGHISVTLWSNSCMFHLSVNGKTMYLGNLLEHHSSCFSPSRILSPFWNASFLNE